MSVNQNQTNFSPTKTIFETALDDQNDSLSAFNSCGYKDPATAVTYTIAYLQQNNGAQEKGASIFYIPPAYFANIYYTYRVTLSWSFSALTFSGTPNGLITVKAMRSGSPIGAQVLSSATCYVKSNVASSTPVCGGTLDFVVYAGLADANGSSGGASLFGVTFSLFNNTGSDITGGTLRVDNLSIAQETTDNTFVAIPP